MGTRSWFRKLFSGKAVDAEEYRAYKSLDRSTQALLSRALDLIKKEDYASALLLYVQVLRSEPESADGIAMFTFANAKLLEVSLQEYKKSDSVRQRALSHLTSGRGTEADAREFAGALIAVKRWDITIKEREKLTGGQFGTGSGEPARLREEDIKAGVFLANAYLSIVRGQEGLAGSDAGLSEEPRAVLEQGLVKMKRAVEYLCLAILPGQRRQQLELLARDFAGEKMGSMLRQLANNPNMIDPIEHLPQLADQMAFQYAYLCHTKYELVHTAS